MFLVRVHLLLRRPSDLFSSSSFIGINRHCTWSRPVSDIYSSTASERALTFFKMYFFFEKEGRSCCCECLPSECLQTSRNDSFFSEREVRLYARVASQSNTSFSHFISFDLSSNGVLSSPFSFPERFFSLLCRCGSYGGNSILFLFIHVFPRNSPRRDGFPGENSSSFASRSTLWFLARRTDLLPGP